MPVNPVIPTEPIGSAPPTNEYWLVVKSWLYTLSAVKFVRLNESRAVFNRVGVKMWVSDKVVNWFRFVPEILKYSGNAAPDGVAAVLVVALFRYPSSVV